jgi:hypothetical protein
MMKDYHTGGGSAASHTGAALPHAGDRSDQHGH